MGSPMLERQPENRFINQVKNTDPRLFRISNYLDTAASISAGNASDGSAMKGPSECHDG